MFGAMFGLGVFEIIIIVAVLAILAAGVVGVLVAVSMSGKRD